MSTRDATRLLAPREVADELGVSTTTIYRAVKHGELAGLRLGERGRVIRVTRAAVDDWLEPARVPDGTTR